MGQVLAYAPPDAEEKKTAYIGMLVFVAGWTMMFGSLLFIYGAMRISANAWPPVGLPLLPLALPGLSTVVIAVSSWTFERAIKTLSHQRTYVAPMWLLLTLALGIGFLALQTYLAFDLFAQGLSFDRGAYAASLYGLGGIHALHVGVGILALLYLVIQTARGTYSPARHIPLRLWSIYWHFVGIVWALILVLVFII